MIGDEALLSLCRAAETGGEQARAVAQHAYERSVAEWQENYAAWQRERAERAVADKVAEVAEVMWLSVLVRRATGTV